jgi:hypothetical protein
MGVSQFIQVIMTHGLGYLPLQETGQSCEACESTFLLATSSFVTTQANAFWAFLVIGPRTYLYLICSQAEQGALQKWFGVCSHGQVKVLAAGDEKELLG